MVDPYIPPEVEVKEFTVRAMVLGVLLAVIMGAANAYLGLKVGMTVSASIPAAVMAMAILKPMKGTVLEINLSKAMGSAGEALAAGIIFTIPAFIIIGAWVEINYWITTAVALLGGVLGVFFTIPLRRILIVDQALPFPEGVACTEVVLAGEEGGSTAKWVFMALGIGAVYKFLISGIGLMHDKVEAIVAIGRGRFFFGGELSAALLGIGYIVGPRIATFVFIGGVLGWVVITPIFLTMVASGSYPVPDGTTMMEALNIVRMEQTVYMGIGAITMGGIWTMFSLRDSMKTSIGHVLSSELEEGEAIRTERDLSVKYAYLAAGAMVIPIFILYWYIADSGLVAGVSAIVLLIAAFFFSAIAGYLAGVVGSSNNPISGVTITTLLFSSLLLLGLGLRGLDGMSTALGVGAVVCCAAAIAGDVMQDFKTGELIGSTPKSLQIGEMVAVVAMALFIAPVLMVLHQAYTIGSPDLPAPQAIVMAGLLRGLFGEGINMIMFLLGVELAILLIFLRLPVLPVAIGIYLPFTLTTPIMLGGISNLLITKIAAKKGITNENEVHGRGILFSSGLVAGEALVGILIALMLVSHIEIKLLAAPLPGLGAILFLGLAGYLFMVALKSVGGSFSDVPGAINESISDLKKIRL